MALSKLSNAKRKKRVRAIKDLPFPIPIASQEEQNNWFHHTGYLHDNHVEVKHSGDLDRLYKMGFFGKGTLSRSKPEFNQQYRYVQVPNSKGEIIHARVMSRRRFVHRLNWNLRKNEAPECYIEYDSSEDVLHGEGLVDKYRTEITKDTDLTGAIDPRTEKSDDTLILWNDKIGVTNPRAEKSDDTLIPWTDSNFGQHNDSEQMLWEENADFWNTDSTVTHDKNQENVLSNSNDFQCSGNTLKGQIQVSDENAPNSKDFRCSGNTMKGQVQVSQEDTPNAISKIISSETSNIEKQNNDVSDTHHQDQNKSRTKSELQHKDEIPSYHCGIMGDKSWHDTNCVNSCQQLNQIDNSGNCDKTETNDSQETDSVYWLEDECDTSDLDSLCQSDHDDGHLFVVDDSDSEIESKRNRKNTRKKWRPVLKRDPFFVKENLHLSFEEAFFLSYGLGCLVVKDMYDGLPDLTQMWQIYSRRQNSFVPNYIAYHYYRSKGWVLKTGLKFGTDFLIYKEGPAFYHGSYSVIVKMVNEGTLIEDSKYKTRDLTWTSLAGLNRLTEQVAKEVLVCCIIKPGSLTEDELLSPKCIPKFQVKEILLSRWISSQERERKKDQM